MKPNTAAAMHSAPKVTTRMFDAAIDPETLICIALADDRGRISQKPTPSTEEFLYERLELYRELMARPYVTGQDLIAAGLTPAADFSQILQYAHKLRLSGVDKENALRQTLGHARSLRK
jgi:tRNA nucleotidyltransferase (CCA-adding enzyme)